ncbi:MAG: hypothetical protein RMK98_08090 [Bacteroidia bacterium]|nr:hypothetical protein [Bacteroidia bacterium]
MLPVLALAAGIVLAQFLYLSALLYDKCWRVYTDYYAIPIHFTIFSSIIIALSLQQRLAADRYILFALALLVILSNMRRVQDGRYMFEVSLGYTRRLVESCWREGIHKAIICTEAMNPYFSWLFSNRITNPLLYTCMLHPDSAVHIEYHRSYREADSLARVTQHQYITFPSWLPMEVGKFTRLNPLYFRVPDTPYRLLTQPQDSSVYAAIEAGKIDIQPTQSLYRARFARGIPMTYPVLEVEVSQIYSSYLPSIPTDSFFVCFSYELYDQNGQKVQMTDYYVPTYFERDLPSYYIPGITLYPFKAEHRGYYQIQFGVFSKKHGFIPKGRRAWLVVE